jgi:hypothetical protein
VATEDVLVVEAVDDRAHILRAAVVPRGGTRDVFVRPACDADPGPARRDHICSKVQRLSGRGLRRIAATSRGSLSAYGTDRPSIFLICVLMGEPVEVGVTDLLFPGSGRCAIGDACPRRITAAASCCARSCLLADVLAAAETSIIGMIHVIAARLAWRSSRLREALGELGGEREDLPVRPVVELDLADQAALAAGDDGRAAHRVALESPLPLQVGPARFPCLVNEGEAVVHGPGWC